LTISYWNGTALVALPNTLTFISTGSSTAPSGLDSLVSNVIPSSAIINGTVKVQISVTFTGSSTLWNNWLSLALLSSAGTVQDVKGSSEMHIKNWSNDVWNNPTRNLTYYPPATVVNTTVIAFDIWNYTTRNLTFYPSVAGELVNITTTINVINATVTSIKNDTVATKSLVQQVWSWVQSIFNWTSVQPSYPQSVAFLPSQYYAQTSTAVVTQVLVNGVGSTASGCTLNIYYPNMTKQTNAATMTYSGDDGLYTYLWTPPDYGSYPVRVNCSGGTITGQLSGAASLGVSAPMNGVMMQMVS